MATAVLLSGCLGGGTKTSSSGPGSPPDHLSTRISELARQVRPLLRFDSSEQWRPLDVPSFFAEPGGQELCADYRHPPSVCLLIRTAPSGGHDRSSGPNLFDPQGIFGDPSTWLSPYSPCDRSAPSGLLLDCDSNHEGIRNVAAIYWHPVRIAGDPHLYLDYWFFYRYNHFPLTEYFPRPFYDEHYGDWEGIVVAIAHPSTDPALAWVAYAQHSGQPFRYLPGALTCNQAQCAGSNVRPDVFVANNSHASYVRPCRQTILLALCSQTDSPLPDYGRDGRYERGADHEAAALLEFPRSSTAWEQWPGNWNSMLDPVIASPGRQLRYSHPNEFECDSSAPCTEGGNSDPCAGWDGADVAAVACRPATVGAALAEGTIGSPRSRQARVIAPRGFARSLGPHYRIASGPGITQVIGPPLRPGASLVLSGEWASGTVLTVRTADASGTATLRFNHLTTTSSSPLTVTVRRTGAGLRGLGATVAPASASGRRPQAFVGVVTVHVTVNQPSAPLTPSCVRTRAGGPILVSLPRQGLATEVELWASITGPIVFERTIARGSSRVSTLGSSTI